MTEAGRSRRRRQKLRHAMDVLLEHRGVVKAAAHELGLSERTLREQMAEFCELEGYATPLEAMFALGQQQQTGVKSAV